MSTITKEVDDHGNVYSVEDRGDGTVIRIKVDPILTYSEPPTTIPLGSTLNVTLQLKDFDGVDRADNREVTFIVDGTPVDEALASGTVTLSLECLAAGSLTIGVAPVEIAMMPITVEVV